MTLYLVGTPIGNMEDITLRALRILREVRLIAAEDTRHTGRLLQHYDIATPMLSYHEYSTPQRLAQLVARLQQEDVALVSDAGMPGLSDPGYRLVRAALDAHIPVIPIPGVTAVVTALVASGLPTDNFLFLGFLPRRRRARQAALADVALLPFTLVCYEAPHRLLDLLHDILQTLGDRDLCIGRELTKLYEELWRGSVSAAWQHFATGQIKGEFTLVLAGAPPAASDWDEAAIRARLAEKIAAGLGHREAAAAVAAESGWRKRDVYALREQAQR